MTAVKRRKCEGGCGRWLTATESLAVGWGRTCLRERDGGASPARSAPQGPGVPAGRSRAATANPVPVCAGQVELPLEDQ